MRRRIIQLAPILIAMLLLSACAGWETNTYKTIGVLGVTYDTSFKGLADLKKQGKITDAQWSMADKAGREFFVVYNGAIDAFGIYLKVKDQPSKDRVIAALNEASLKLGKVSEYYNIWKGVK